MGVKWKRGGESKKDCESDSQREVRVGRESERESEIVRESERERLKSAEFTLMS